MNTQTNVLKTVISTIESKGYSINQDEPQNLTLKHDIGCDSLDAIEINMELETIYGLDLPEFADQTTIADVVAFIESSIS